MLTYTYHCAHCVLFGSNPRCQNPLCGQQVPLRAPREDGMDPGYGGQMSVIPEWDRVAISAELRITACSRTAPEGCCSYDPPIALYGRLWAPSYSPHDNPLRYRGFRIRAEVCAPCR